MSKKRARTPRASATKRPHQDLDASEIDRQIEEGSGQQRVLEEKIEVMRTEAKAISDRVLPLAKEKTVREIEAAYAKASETKNIDALTEPNDGVLKRLGFHAYRGRPDAFFSFTVCIRADGTRSTGPPHNCHVYDTNVEIRRSEGTMRYSRSKPVSLWYPTVQEFLRQILRMNHVPLKHAHHMFPMIFIKAE